MGYDTISDIEKIYHFDITHCITKVSFCIYSSLGKKLHNLGAFS